MTPADYGPGGGTHAWRQLRAQFAARLPLPCSVCMAPVNPGDAWHLDHVVPRSQGGTDVWPAHARCNTSKGARRVDPRPAYIDPMLERT